MLLNTNAAAEIWQKKATDRHANCNDSKCRRWLWMFWRIQDSRNLTNSNYFEKKEGTSNVQNRRDEGTVQRTVKNDIDDSKLIEVDNSYTYMNQHLVLVDELSMGIRIVSMKIIISSKEGRGYFVYCFVFLVYYNWTLFSLFKNCVIHGMGVSWVGNFCH